MTVVKEIGVDGAAVVFLLVVMTLVPVSTVVTCCVVGLVVVLCSVVVTVIGTVKIIRKSLLANPCVLSLKLLLGALM